MTPRRTNPPPLPPCSEQIIALLIAACENTTEHEVRTAVGSCRQQGWDDRRLLKEAAGVILRGETPRDLTTAATQGIPARSA